MMSSEVDKVVASQPSSEVAKQNSEPTVAPAPDYKNNPAQLMEFFDNPKNWGETEVKAGRAWNMEELRIKSNQDIHKLWFVLLKERNMLLTMKEVSDRELELFPCPERIEKVEESMINLENVVRERNKAYWELEVGEGETGERQSVFRRDQFGRHRIMGCSEHLIPYWMNTPWRKLYGPGYGKAVQEFIHKLREKRVTKEAAKFYGEHQFVRQILRRFPNTDLEHLQTKYPRVKVYSLKQNLDEYKERHYVSKRCLT
jgi:large subunit ribosomal protein L47